jgi:DNA repair protein RecN (Recombination protein N)
MLVSLRVENFALIDDLSLDFSRGLTVLTGETGAGKSILLDAVDILLGGKASGRVIRTGAERAILEGQFHLNAGARQWLEQLEIAGLGDDRLICTREISSTHGSLRSRSRVNGVLVNLQQLEQLRPHLVEITAQGQTVKLSNPTAQRSWLDDFGGPEVLGWRDQVRECYGRYQQAKQALENHRQSEQQRLQQLDLLRFQLEDLHRASLAEPEELTLLEQEYQRLTHCSELKQGSHEIYQLLYEADHDQVLACSDLLGQAYKQLADLVSMDNQLQPICDLVQEAAIQVQEAARQASLYADGLETDPARLSEVEERLSQLHQICRKYGPTLTEAIAFQSRIETEYYALTEGSQSEDVLEQALIQAQTQLTTACENLTQARKTVAQRLESQLTAELKPLAMDRARFAVDCRPIPPTATGADGIGFLISPNPGEPLQPLAEIASGGEMSRFLLALKACFSQIDPVGTLVFDEIDTGVSGRVTQAIATKLHSLGQHHQVLCVTHQPLVAAMADHHLRVEKQIIPGVGKTSDRTVVRVVPLDAQEKRQELAQLAGGSAAQDAIAFAEALLVQASQLRNGDQPHGVKVPTPIRKADGQAQGSKTRKSTRRKSLPA